VFDSDKVRIAVVGGGTGGHIFPALAVVNELRVMGEHVEARLATGRKAVERDWAREVQPEPVRLMAAPMPYGFQPLGMARATVSAGLGVLQTLLWWRCWKPAAMLTFGGYVSVPPAIAARLTHIPYAFHSADALPDRSARLLARRARLITVNYAEAQEAFPDLPVQVTGQPVRPWLFTTSREHAARNLGLQPDRMTLLIVGGSQGARSLNRASVAAAPRLMGESDLQVLHLPGPLDCHEVKDALADARIPNDRWQVREFLYEMEWALAVADLAVTRAGANALAELALAGVPMIMVPYPHAGGHQNYNAEPLQRAGAGIIVEDAELTAERLANEVLGLCRDEKRRREMAQAARRWARPDAARRVAELVLEIAGGHN
jgi:UDP-N-acetylglucosamine--N-acetylmuramyl-(pentapeptide) pyrophosphoryl-undecaprenol N-acetylglucosamine transferase